MVNDLVPPSCDYWKYVDDLTASEVIPKYGNSTMQVDLNYISSWASANYIKLNPQKCKQYFEMGRSCRYDYKKGSKAFAHYTCFKQKRHGTWWLNNYSHCTSPICIETVARFIAFLCFDLLKEFKTSLSVVYYRPAVHAWAVSTRQRLSIYDRCGKIIYS
jgi:hypothetical protein